LLLLSTAACTSPKQVNEAPSPSSEDAIRTLLSGLAEAYNAQDGNAVIAFYAPNATVQVSLGGELYALSVEDLAKAVEMKKEGWKQSGMRIEETAIEELTLRGSQASALCRFQVGTRNWSGSYASSFEFEQVNGRWLVMKEMKP
jgi:ketosteroid isomerase-like protein